MLGNVISALVATRQDRRRARTRDALISAAEALFAARGPDAVSVDEIVSAADVAKGSFYNHFSDKDALAREIARSVRAEVEREVDARNEGIGDPAMRSARALCIFLEFAHTQPARATILAQLVSASTDANATLNRGLSEDVKSGLALGRFGGVSRESAILFILGVTLSGMHRALNGLTPEVLVKLGRELIFLKLRGLGLPDDEAQAIAGQATAEIFEQGRSGS